MHEGCRNRKNGNAVHRNRNSTIWYDGDAIANICRNHFNVRFWRRQGFRCQKAGGRGAAWMVSTPDAEMVLRRYLRGGMIARITRENFVFRPAASSRAMREFALLQEMRNLKLPVPRPLAALHERHGACYRAAIIVERIDRSAGVASIVKNKPLRPEIWARIGATINAFHEKGIFHADLNCHNILLDDKEDIWLIDFDKCAHRSDGKWKNSNLERLRRSLRKKKGMNPLFFWEESDWKHLLDGYSGRM